MHSPRVIKRAVSAEALPCYGTLAERFRLAAAAGFEGVELEWMPEPECAIEAREAALTAGIRIHQVKVLAHWSHPLSSDDPSERDRGIDQTLRALENANLWGADSLLLIPGVVTPRVSYSGAWTRSRDAIRSAILPAAATLGITLAVENVWRGFLLSPGDFIRFIDELESPLVRANLDVGNMVFGHPEHWIRAAGHRIVKLHAKDFHLDLNTHRFGWRKIGEGSIEWNAVRAALDEVGFSGWVTNTESLEGLAARAVNFGMRRLGPRGAQPLRRTLWHVQSPGALETLRGAAERLNRLVQ